MLYQLQMSEGSGSIETFLARPGIIRQRLL